MFDHGQVTGSCSTCHDGHQATGEPTGHFITTLQCDSCHSTTSWLPVVFRHTSSAYPGDHAGNPPCTACHTSNTQTIAWQYPAYQPDCAGCHAGDYRAGVDRHHGSVSVDRDCGASGCHRVSSSRFGD